MRKKKYWKIIIESINFFIIKYKKKIINIIKTMAIQQNDGGFNITGWWENIKNGHRLYIKDSVIDGDDMNLITNEGIFPLNDVMNSYVQCLDEDIPQSEINKINDTNKKLENVFEEMPYTGNISLDTPLSDDILSGKNDINDKIRVDENAVTTEKIVDKNENTIQIKEDSNDFKDIIIKKVIENSPGLILSLSVNWENMPKSELRMLHNMFNITSEDISNYIIKNITPSDDMVYEMFKNILNDNNGNDGNERSE